jgi:hypothetical protein
MGFYSLIKPSAYANGLLLFREIRKKMKKLWCFFVVLLLAGMSLHAQTIPTGVKMGMSYAQIRGLMSGGEWQNPEGNLYPFFNINPTGLYIFGIDPRLGLATLEINLIGTTVQDVVKKLAPKYGTPEYSDGSYVWGMSGGLADNVFGIEVQQHKELGAFIQIRYIFMNSLSLLQE